MISQGNLLSTLNYFDRTLKGKNQRKQNPHLVLINQHLQHLITTYKNLPEINPVNPKQSIGYNIINPLQTRNEIIPTS